jgi:hypothetical protein
VVGSQCSDKDELAAVMKLLDERGGDFWPDFIPVAYVHPTTEPVERRLKRR